MSQNYNITLKQRVDGQMQVTSVKVPKSVLIEDPFIKEEIKHEMENKLEENHIKVLKDIGIIEYG